MAKKAKFESEQVAEEPVDTTAAPEVTLTAEEAALKEAMGSIDTLKSFAETASDQLKVMIATYVALVGALGTEAGATQHAWQNLVDYKSPKVKEKKVKEPSFNEKAELAKVFEVEDFNGALTEFAKNDKLSEKLKTLIQTYQTLAAIDGLPEGVVDASFENLKKFGKKNQGNRSGGYTRTQIDIEVDGEIYPALTSALKAKGYSSETPEGEKDSPMNVAWKKIRPKLLKEGKAEYEGRVYTNKSFVDEPKSESEAA